VSRVVVDTDVVSFILRNDSRAKLYAPHLNGKELVLSFMTVAELYLWALERNWGEKRSAQLREHIQSFAIYPFTNSLCHRWAHVTDERRRAGRPIDSQDAWIAATAIEHGIPLVTHNRGHFEQTDGLTVVSEA